jgi:kumamolisin
MRKLVYATSFALALAGSAVYLSAQGPQGSQGARGWVHVPESTVERLEDIGVAAHTNHLIHVLPMASSGPSGHVPQDLWNLYTGSTPGPLGNGSKVVAIVDAYHYATALADFNTFSAQFGLPQESSTNPLGTSNTRFQVVYASNRQPRANCGWAQEAALDIEWAHAMAPNAKIILVEAASASYSDLFKAVDKATQLVKSAGGGQVSMSWGGSEFSGETAYDSHFPLLGGVVYLASSGDKGGIVSYPSVSPRVVAAGGTSIVSLSAGTESGWSGSGGGISLYEPQQNFQAGLGYTKRAVPDVSYDADPNTGVSVYDSTSCQGFVGWMVFGGTSVSAPSLAGLTNAAGAFASDSQAQLTHIYANRTNGAFYDVTSGTAGSNTAKTGYDLVTGVGTPRGFSGM